MAGKIRNLSITVVCYLLIILTGTNLFAQQEILAKVRVSETNDIARDLEYVEFLLKLPAGIPDNLVAEDAQSGQLIPCQILLKADDSANEANTITVVFPVTLQAMETREFILHVSDQDISADADISYTGEGVNLAVENKFYRADLTKSDQSEAKSHASGQLRELLVKMGYDVLLFRNENRMHWAPNFQRADQENYENISGWENPAQYQLIAGPYLIRTERGDLAPNIPEIFLSATYSYYAGLPYFRFYSSIQIIKDVRLKLLRNDEMTMDSLFTHVAFQRPDGTIEDLTFSEREQRLKQVPIESDAIWVCFYHAEKGYAFGSIRLKYDNRNNSGFESPTYNPHTKISNGDGGGKYWNRRLIDEKEILVPQGSGYLEENAYLVFNITGNDKFSEIKTWCDQIQNPLQVSVLSE